MQFLETILFYVAFNREFHSVSHSFMKIIGTDLSITFKEDRVEKTDMVYNILQNMEKNYDRRRKTSLVPVN